MAEYPAPGLPELAEEIKDAVKPTWVGEDIDSWGLDHGTWSVLAHMFPDAAVPVVQLSINAEKDLSYHFELGRRLAPLRERGVLVVGSGNIVHNLRSVNAAFQDDGYDWAQRFDEEAREQLLSEPGDAVALGLHRYYRDAAPTPDHFIPVLYFAGLASEGPSPLLRSPVATLTARSRWRLTASGSSVSKREIQLTRLHRQIRPSIYLLTSRTSDL